MDSLDSLSCHVHKKVIFMRHEKIDFEFGGQCFKRLGITDVDDDDNLVFKAELLGLYTVHGRGCSAGYTRSTNNRRKRIFYSSIAVIVIIIIIVAKWSPQVRNENKRKNFKTHDNRFWTKSLFVALDVCCSSTVIFSNRFLAVTTLHAIHEMRSVWVSRYFKKFWSILKIITQFFKHFVNNYYIFFFFFLEFLIRSIVAHGSVNRKTRF